MTEADTQPLLDAFNPCNIGKHHRCKVNDYVWASRFRDMLVDFPFWLNTLCVGLQRTVKLFIAMREVLQGNHSLVVLELCPHIVNAVP